MKATVETRIKLSGSILLANDEWKDIHKCIDILLLQPPVEERADFKPFRDDHSIWRVISAKWYTERKSKPNSDPEDYEIGGTIISYRLAEYDMSPHSAGPHEHNLIGSREYTSEQVHQLEQQ